MIEERAVGAGSRHENVTDEAELRAINEQLIIAGVRQQELAEEAARSGELYRQLARNFPNGMVFLFDQSLRHMLADGSGLAALHLDKEALEGRTIWEALPPQICEQLEPAYRAALAGETVVQEVPFVVERGSPGNPDGFERIYRVHAHPVRNEGGEILAGMAMTQDVTEQRQAEGIIRWQAHHDPLTGLPNRALLRDRLEQVLAMSERSGEFVALLFLDLDRFKHVNDTLGHAVGDRLLQAVAARLTLALRAEDTVARMGGDEFLVLLPSLQAPHDATIVAQKITNLFASPLVIDGYELSVTASVGVSVFPFDGRDAESLLRNADNAMYRSKEQQRGGYQLYDEATDAASSERVHLEKGLRSAVEHSEFVLLYQPKVLLRTGRITAVEALLRWNHADLGLLPPARFLVLAERMGLIRPLGEWVLGEACRQAVVWQEAGYAVPVVVNVSANQFGQRGLVNQVAAALALSGLAPEWLGLDVTESALLQNKEEAGAILWDLKQLGIRLCVDNFGTGYSTLASLRHFPFDALKVDQTFVHTLSENLPNQALVKSMVDLAHALNMEAIADGVETEVQRECLSRMGCDAVLGYLLHPPLLAEQLAPLLQHAKNGTDASAARSPVKDSRLQADLIDIVGTS